MNRISEITRRDILDLFQNGMNIDDIFDVKKIFYPYYGRLEEIEFLKRIYNLKIMPSFDSRFENAEQDIWQHTINNDDFSYGWVFDDERFELKTGSDEKYLRFICEIFHPVVRDDKGYWNEFYNEINMLLKNDGYELYPFKKKSNRNIYNWRLYSNEEGQLFIPYSQRNASDIKSKKIKLSISRNARNQIYQLLEKNNSTYQKTHETGWNEIWSVAEEVFDNIRQFYTPKYYNDQKVFAETPNLQEFILATSPFYVIDAIEFFGKNVESTDFECQINAILKLNNIPFRLEGIKMINTFDDQVKLDIQNIVHEAGLSELLQDASNYYEQANYKIAVEKLWDAFERLKIYYSPVLNKKNSTEKLIEKMSSDKPQFVEMFNREFKELTILGNDFRIRHHEVTKIDIEDDLLYKYFYKRCISLISTALEYLD